MLWWPLWGSATYSGRLLSCWDEWGKLLFVLGRQLSSNPWSSHDLRAGPQLKEENPHLPQGYLKIVEPLQGYINKLSNGKEEGERENHTKLMISWVVWDDSKEIMSNLWSHKWGLERENDTKTYDLISGVGSDNWREKCVCETYDLGGNLQSAREEPSVQLLPSRLWIFQARVRRRGSDEAVAFASMIVSTAVIILINMTSLASF